MKSEAEIMTVEEAKQKVIDGGLILEHNGQADLTRGHLSVRVPGDPNHFFMKPHSYGFDEITMDNIVICNLDGEKVGGGGRRHSEVFIHSEIYKARPDVNSVIHSHPDNAVALSATGKQLKMISQPSVAFADGLPYYTDTIDLIRSKDMGEGVAKALGQCKAVLMRNHGVAVVGRSVEETVILAIMLENACRIQLLAEAAGGIGDTFDAEYIERLHYNISRPEQYSINFEYLKRKVMRGRG
ncbi:L-fuculose-phosphate aldolase [Noviherbaspirillum humi]|uniref:L-fuculose-phosphate aldolase n=1 Tax=Noviherbaspirillum humi TaxID=1688639 RepID=A0A239HYY0_9BURK|nr:class II aldolase/adducin family protein [Noviherbaspirillum humi]SNS86439.1 L-fuculose-phosphate aldolase [Noviherbaspirillum humi]